MRGRVGLCSYRSREAGRIKSEARPLAIPETNRPKLIRFRVDGGPTDPKSARHRGSVDQVGGLVFVALTVALAQQLNNAHRERLYVLTVEHHRHVSLIGATAITLLAPIFSTARLTALWV